MTLGDDPWGWSKPLIMSAEQSRTFCEKCGKMIRPGEQYIAKSVISGGFSQRRTTKWHNRHYPSCKGEIPS